MKSDAPTVGQQVSGSSIADLLEESAARYQGRGQGDVIQARAFALVELARKGADQVLLPYILEDLRTAHHPYALAAAAKALSHLSLVPADARALLARAVSNLGHQDRIVDLDAWPPRPGHGTSAKKILRAAEGALPRASACCAEAATKDLEIEADSLLKVGDLEVEDQDGARARLGDLLLGHRCLVAFFYSRCGNPLKCSQTVTDLGATHRRLQEKGTEGFRVLGVTYDPDFDLPPRLRRYGMDRGLVFGASLMLLRVPDGMARLSRALRLGVGFGPGTVNAHRLEWLLTNPSGAIRQSGARRHWEIEDIVREMTSEQNI